MLSQTQSEKRAGKDYLVQIPGLHGGDQGHGLDITQPEQRQLEASLWREPRISGKWASHCLLLCLQQGFSASAPWTLGGCILYCGLPRWHQWLKNPPVIARDIRDMDLIPGSGRYPGGGNGNPLQYSWLENLMGRGAWRAPVHGVAKSRARLKWLSTHACTSFVVGGQPVHCRAVGCISNLEFYPLGTTYSLGWQPKISPDIAKCPLGGQNCTWLKVTSIWHFKSLR